MVESMHPVVGLPRRMCMHLVIATNLAGLAHVSLRGQTRRDLLPTSIAASDLWVTNS
jgi:hypothetical protein